MSDSAAIRARAARIVSQVAMRGRSLDDLLARESSQTPQQRGLLRSLCYDSIRWYLRLDALLVQLLNRPDQELAPEVRALAIVGLCQLLYTDIPAHAAVTETVNATRLLGQPRAAPLVNALLRRYQREHNELSANVDETLSLRSAHPRWLVDRLTADWGSDAEAILEANNQRPPFWIRVNRLRCSGADYVRKLEAAGIVVAAAQFDAEALLLQQAVDVRELVGFEDGWASVQDAAAQLAARFVAARPGERVLDACAAPGGKTAHLLELQPELAEVVAVDVSAERLDRVAENMQRLGLRATLIAADAAETQRWWDGRLFDRILLDVPCSATGVIRRHPDIKLLRRAGDIPAFALRQARLLESLWPALAPGGQLVYASCSALSAENSAVVGAFIENRADVSDVTAAQVSALGLSGRTDRGYRIAAGTAGMDGFYYACLKKSEG
jgi:16S rRNA (cytosine967-C5)-methyltransferase